MNRGQSRVQRCGLAQIALLFVVIGTWFAPNQVEAQACTVADCPAGSNVVTPIGTVYFGTPGPDCIVGTAADETMFGLGGADFICGGGGADLILGGDGDDEIQGEDGNDEIFGGEGADNILGGEGADVLNGNDGNDFVFGEAGEDTVNGGLGADFLSGGTESDTINGGPGDDTAAGGDGLDLINGDAGDDTLSGGAGPDIINGGPGNDLLSGDSDNDTLRGDEGIDTGQGGTGLNVCLVEIPDPFCQILTHATVGSFYSTNRGGSVVVGWVTDSETGTIGFELLREIDGEWAPLHDGLLPGLLTAPQGGIYEFRDAAAVPGQTARYLLVEVTAAGKRSQYGPYEVSAVGTSAGILADGDSFAREPHAIPQVAFATKSTGTKARQSDGPAVAMYLGVDATGLYVVQASAIAAELGVEAATVREAILGGGVSITEQGEPAAWFGSGDGAQLFFFGTEIDSLYTRERLYRLSLADGDVMATRSAAPGAITPNLTYEDTVRAEEDQVAFTVISPDPESDYWHYSPAILASQSRSVTLSLESLAGAGTVRVELVGASTTPHTVEVRVNGNLVGTATGQNFDRFGATLPVLETAFVEGENVVELTTDSDVFLDSVELRYTRSYETNASSLEFRSNQTTSVQLGGLVGSGVRLFDVTDPRAPVQLIDFVADAGGVRFAAQAGSEYFALTETELRSPTSIWADVASSWRDPANAYDHLVIAPAELVEAAGELADHRNAEGLRSTVVELQDIYDEFAFGLPNPNAIRDFLRLAYEQWADSPRYVVLVGSGSLDYRDLLGFGGNLLPPLLVQTPGGLYSSDNRYADFVGTEGFPELAIGRLPVVSVEELDSVVSQIVEYENSVDSLTTDVAFLADLTRRDGDFAESANVVAEALPGNWTANRAYRSSFGDLDSARAAFVSAFTQGPRAVNYVGHASGVRLGLDENLFEITDLEGASIDGAQPLVTALTCNLSRFAAPQFVSLGEALFLRDEGAIAVWGGAAESDNQVAVAFGQRFYQSIASGTERLGDLILGSYPATQDFEPGFDTARVFHLFGDPGLRVNKASDGTGGTGGMGGIPGDGGSSGSGGTGGDGVDGGGGCSVGARSGGFGDGPLMLLALLGFAVAYRRLRRRHS